MNYEIPENMKAAVDALRGALGDNPLILTEETAGQGTGGRYFFADWDLWQAIERVVPYLPEPDEDPDVIPHRPGLQG